MVRGGARWSEVEQSGARWIGMREVDWDARGDAGFVASLRSKCRM